MRVQILSIFGYLCGVYLDVWRCACVPGCVLIRVFGCVWGVYMNGCVQLCICVFVFSAYVFLDE